MHGIYPQDANMHKCVLVCLHVISCKYMSWFTITVPCDRLNTTFKMQFGHEEQIRHTEIEIAAYRQYTVHVECTWYIVQCTFYTLYNVNNT